MAREVDNDDSLPPLGENTDKFLDQAKKGQPRSFLIDGAPPDALLLHDYSIGDNGQKRVFKIRRGKKKLKLSMKAVSPI